MRFNRTNLALEKDDTNRFLPWLIAFMTFLAALSVAGLLMLKQISNTFEYNSQFLPQMNKTMVLFVVGFYTLETLKWDKIYNLIVYNNV